MSGFIPNMFGKDGFTKFYLYNALKLPPNDKMPNKTILRFIWDFTWGFDSWECDVIHHTFTQGYCYYFARMLEDAFPGGKLVWAFPFRHIVYVYDDVCYDIKGVYNVPDKLLPLEELEDILESCMHRGHDNDLVHEMFDFYSIRGFNYEAFCDRVYSLIPIQDRLPIKHPEDAKDIKSLDVKRHLENTQLTAYGFH